MIEQQTLIVPPTGSPTTQSWDGSGNLALSNTGGALTTFSWDGENRLATLQNAGAAASTYLYSSDTGYRQVASAPSGTTRYLWDGQNVLAEQDASHNLIAAYTNDPGNWGGLASQRRGAASSFYGYDQQGSARILAGASGSVTDNYSFKAFGEELQSGSGTVNPYRYVGAFGYYRDAADWMYVRARWLAAESGRWVGVDPMQQFGGARYGCADWRPTLFVDASGMICNTCYKGVRSNLHLVPCPPSVSGGRDGLCNLLRRANPKDLECCGITKADLQCLLDWCNNSPKQPGNVYCVSQSDPCCAGKDGFCAATCLDRHYGPRNTYICLPPNNGSCACQCHNTPEKRILHERLHTCGFPHQETGPRDHRDPAETAACCLLRALGQNVGSAAC